MSFSRAVAGDDGATIALHAEANAENVAVLDPPESRGRLLEENRIAMVYSKFVRIASTIALCVAACCLVTFIFASLAVLVCFRKLRAIVAGLTAQLLSRTERAFVLSNNQANPDTDPR
jgi:hypothetical protein